MVGDQIIGSSSQSIPLAMISALRLHPLGCRKSWPSGTPDASGTPSRSFAVVIGLGNHEESANCRCFFPHVLLEAGRGDFRILQPIHSFMVSMIAGNFANAQSFGVSRPAGDQS